MDNFNQNELIEAKRILYSLLLHKPNDKLSDSEVNLMSELSDDDDIQAIIRASLRELNHPTKY